MKKEFNWDEFKNSERMIVVHCKTKDEANDFCSKMDYNNMNWKTGESYIMNNCWDNEKNKTCYTNSGLFGAYDYFKSKNIKILEWSDYMKPNEEIKELKFEVKNTKGEIVFNDLPIGTMFVFKDKVSNEKYLGMKIEDIDCNTYILALSDLIGSFFSDVENYDIVKVFNNIELLDK